MAPTVLGDYFTISMWHPAVSIKYRKCQVSAILLNPRRPGGRLKKQVFPVYSLAVGFIARGINGISLTPATHWNYLEYYICQCLGISSTDYDFTGLLWS
jgi:hypothetical protein